MEADETELVEHVGLALDRASSKLERVKQRLKDVQEEAAAELRLLTEAETKLSAAIIAALLSKSRGKV